ncbi:hypothetical protein V2J09_020321 [Rumex salicifolius]
MEKKSKVLVVGGTGYIGKRLVEASLKQGHETYVLLRPEAVGLDVDKLQILLGHKKKGAHLVEGSFSDHRSLVDAVKKVDVVISAMSGVHFRSHNLFLPSEFGMDPARMGDALEPGRVSFDEKMEVRKAIEAANIPFTYVSANCFAAYFVPNLSQLRTLLPPKESVLVYGDGNVKVAYVDEDDVATYALKTIDDPRTLNKTIYIRPPDNVLSQRQLIEIWEKLSGKEISKKSLSGEEFLSMMKDGDFATQVGIGHFYHVYYEGCLTNFELGEEEEASKLYPDVEYVRMDEYLKLYLLG